MKKILNNSALCCLMAFMALLGRAESWVDENQNVWGYSVSGGSATIIGTLQQSGVLRVPSAVSGIPVVSIAGNAFERHRWLSGAIIPEGVTNVGYVAFDSCANLRSVSLPNSLISIEGWAFGYCSELESVTIPVGVVRIGEDAFFACSSLAEVTIPSSVENIGGDAFWGCDSLRTVYVDPGNVARVRGLLRGSGLSLSNISFVEIPYSGGTFANTGEFERAEAEVGTKTVVVDIVRNSTGNMRQSMTIDSPGRSSTSFVDIIWLEGETKKAVLLQDFDTRYFTLGRNVILKLLDQNGLARSILSIPCVVRENSSVNPDFSDCPDFGVWTMDLEAAMRKVRKTIETTGSNAYTLVSVQGSQWCPDCEDVERNFLGLQDDSGRNRFAMWAKSRNVALAVVDIPNFRGPLSSDVNTPSLLSRAAYKTSLSGSGLRSGLGYLTRKNVSDADAEKMLARNYDLVTRLTSQGGFRRPEDRNPTRTGVPIFVLLRKDGSVAARLTQWSVMGPTATDRANFDNYIKRFEEMLWIADHDASEIENNSAFGTVDELSANGGWWTATLCNADSVDVFRLTAWSGGVRQSIAVTGNSSARVRVSLIAREGEFEEELVSSTGCLSDGITVEHELVSGADNFVKIEADDLSSEGFKLGSPIDANFQQYEISCDCVIIPREEQGVARPARGSDKLTVYLEEGTVYLMEGLVGCAALAPCGCAIGMYRATVTGNVTVTLRDVDGRLTHQIWRSGAVGFRESTLVVGEGSCWAPIEVVLKREGGKSGRISVRVDAVEVAHAAGRYRFDPTIVTWEDGDSDDKSVSLTIFDDVRYDGKGLIELRLSEVESNIGDATIAEDGGTCLITVYDDDCPSPGTEVDVFWDPQDGTSLLLHQKGVCGKAIGTLPTPTRSKYKFNGWYTAVVGGTKVSSTTKVTGDVTYYAHWTYTGMSLVAAAFVGGCAEMGSVSGGKTAKGGTKVTLKATAKKGYVFAGWYRDVEGWEPVEGETDYRSPSYSYVVAEDDTTFYAKFISVEDDRIEVETSVCSEFVPGIPIGREALEVYVMSESLPTVRVTGLPSGLKFDAKTLAISGTPTKSGVYIATVTATSAGKKTATDTLRIVVRRENEPIVDAGWDASKGKVTGMGVCAAGKALTLKATANKGYVFAGWYWDADWCSDGEGGWRLCDFYDPIDWGVDYRNPTLTVPGSGEDVLLYARFIPEYEDDVDVSAWVAGEYTRGMGIEPIEIDVDSESLPTIKVTGLPTGLKFTNKRIVSKWGLIEAEANTIYGTPTKSGVYTVTVSATTAGKWTSTKQFRIIVRGANEYAVSAKGVYRCSLNACCCDYTPSLDAVSGNGVYAFGKKVTLKAPTAPKGQVFAGWYVTDDRRYADDENWWGDPPEDFFGICSPVVGDADYRNPSLTVTAGRVDRLGGLYEGDFECYALYMYSEFDTELRANVEDAYYLNGAWSLKLDVESRSLPTVTVKGLPFGLKFDAKTLTISGTPTKPGTYPITLSLKNKTITKTRTQTFTLHVANIESPYLVGVDYSSDAYSYSVGSDVRLDIGSCVRGGYSISGVSGLPKGVSYNKTTGMIEGCPTQDGAYTVSISLKNGRQSSNATLTLNVSWVEESFSLRLYRYVAARESLRLSRRYGDGLSFAKSQGAPPSGVKISADTQQDCMMIEGVPTSAGTFSTTYTLNVRKGGKKIPCARVVLQLEVLDPAQEGSGAYGEALNASCAKARTFNDLMILDDDGSGRMIGVLTLTLPPTGKASGKLVCKEGTLSFSAKNWDAIFAYDGRLLVTLTCTKAAFMDYRLEVEANRDGSITVVFFDGMNTSFPIGHPDRLWDRTYPADAYAGYYTVSLRNEDIDGPGADYAPIGSGCLTLKMKSASEINAGKMTWAGILPNGKSVSGTSILSEIEGGLAVLPFAKSVGHDWCAGAMGVRNGQVSQPHLDGFGAVKTIWEHVEKSRETTKGDYSISFEPLGGLYDESSSFLDYGSVRLMPFEVLLPDWNSDAYGTILPVRPAWVEVTGNKMTILDQGGNENLIKLSFNRSNGSVSGSFKVFYEDEITGTIKQIPATYQGVVHQFDGCFECGHESDNLPFVEGFWMFSDKRGGGGQILINPR